MWFGTHTDVCIKNVHRDFPSGPVVTDSPGSVGDTCLISVWGAKTPHAMEEVSQSNTTRKPMPQLLSTRSSVQPLIRVRLFVTPWTAVRQASLSITAPGACSNSGPLSQWCHPTVSSSVVPFSSSSSHDSTGRSQMTQQRLHVPLLRPDATEINKTKPNL